MPHEVATPVSYFINNEGTIGHIQRARDSAQAVLEQTKDEYARKQVQHWIDSFDQAIARHIARAEESRRGQNTP